MPYFVDYPVIQWVMITGCSFCAFLLTGCFCWSLWHTTREGIRHLRRLHQVPCDRCQYFTGEQWLKCTVHPYKAFSEEAIGCLDFVPLPQTKIPEPKLDRCRRSCLKQ